MIWNPSEGIEIGSFTIRFYSLMFVIAFGLGWYITKRIYDKENIPLDKLDTLFIWTVIATLLGARLGHVFFTIGSTFETIFPKYFCLSNLKTVLNLRVSAD